MAASMILIDTILSAASTALSGKERDTLRLTSEGRRWGRRRVLTTAGREIALALPTGTVLAIGSVLWIDADWYLEVEAAPEPVIAIVPRTPLEGLRIAFEVGNRHFSVAVDGERLLVPDDTAMAQLLDRLGVHWQRAEAVYQPIGFGHTHAPDHDHDGREDAHAQAHAHGLAHTHDHEH
jgi:urease accessory protein